LILNPGFKFQVSRSKSSESGRYETMPAYSKGEGGSDHNSLIFNTLNFKLET
jgi:hypothetical protein